MASRVLAAFRMQRLGRSSSDDLRENALITLKAGFVYALRIPDAVTFALVASAPAHSTMLGVLIADKLEIKEFMKKGPTLGLVER